MNKIKLAALAGAVAFASAAYAQQQDFSKVEVTTTDLGNKTYLLEGAGGNVTIAVGTDGIIMVDSQFAPMHDKLKASIEKISPLPIKYLINTHYHGDHTGGNAAFHKDGATVVAQDNIRVRLAAGNATNGLTGAKMAAQPADALPTDTYSGGTKIVQVAARRSSITSTIRIPMAILGSSSTTPMCSTPATPSATPAATTRSTSPMAATSGA